MDHDIRNLLDELDFEEMSKLLDKEIYLQADARSAARIRASVFRKAGVRKSRMIRFSYKNVMVASIIAFVLIVSGMTGGYYAYQKPIAYLDVDINPSIELGINRWHKIVSVEAYNRDGENILKAKDVLNKDIHEGIKDIMDEANEQGYFDAKDGGAVSLTTVTDDQKAAEEIQEQSETAVQEYADEAEAEVEIVTGNAALERRDKARAMGITPGKLNLIEKLQALDPQATAEDYKDVSVKEIMKATKELKKQKKSQEIENPSEGQKEDLIDEISEDKKSEIKQKDNKKANDNKKVNNNKKIEDNKETDKKGDKAEQTRKIQPTDQENQYIKVDTKESKSNNQDKNIKETKQSKTTKEVETKEVNTKEEAVKETLEQKADKNKAGNSSKQDKQGIDDKDNSNGNTNSSTKGKSDNKSDKSKK